MNIESLRHFLLDLNNAGYAGGKNKEWVKESDGSTTIPFEKGEWKSHDNFFGGEPYGGRTIVFYKDKPVWMVVYYGWVEEKAESGLVYEILRNALKQMPADAPFRGPKECKENDFIYANSWDGNVERFSGEEQITQNGKLSYRADYLGGLVDQRPGI